MLAACSKDETGCTTTYEEHIKPIIDNSCAYSGCHSGADASEWVPENSIDYTNYEGILANLESGLFTARVLTVKNMPPDQFIPPDKPTELSEEELELIKCWVESGYPKD